MQLRQNSQFTSKVTTGAGTAWDLGTNKAAYRFRYWVKGASVTTGGTVKLQLSYDGTNFFDAATATVNANGVFSGTVDGPARYARLNVTARTDGTFDGRIDALVV